MNKKLLVMIPSVTVMLVATLLILYATSPQASSEGDLEVSLSSGGASLDEGPIGSVSPTYDLSSHQTLSRVILLIRENYVEPERINSYQMFLSALDYIQKTVPEVMIDDTQAPEHVKIAVGSAEQTFDLGGLDQLWQVTMALRDIFHFLQTQLTDPDQRREVEYAAINGMLSTLDPHSVLLKPESFEDVKLSTKGEFGGLGIVISIREGALAVISPIEGTPAARAGIKTKDRIVKIGEESTVNMSLEEAVQRLRGKPGSKVNIWVLRKGWTEPRRYPLMRAVIKIESVSSEMLADSIGYLRIKSFQNNTYDDMHEHLERLRKRNKGELKGLVLDLRNNPGGLLDQAILVSDRFIDKGPIVITVGEGNKKREEKPAHFSGTERDYPIAVLVNGGSASASEIVSGALKNHDRAVIIGQQTFGKGSVQVLYDFKDKSALKLTIAQYLTPGDISIQSVGITPDVEIVPATLNKDALHLFVDDDSPHEKDLEKHLDRRGQKADAPPGKPLVRIVHLAAQSEPPKEEAAPAEEEEDTPEKFEYDFETRLAHDALTRAKSVDRQAVIESAMELFRARSDDEGRRIEERMRELGVDWSRGDGPAVATTQAELSLTVKNKGTVTAGDMLTLQATLRNPGPTALVRTYAVTTSDNPLLKNLEFVFGKVPPGQSKSWSIDIKLPEEMSPRADLVTLTLGDASGLMANFTSSTLMAIDEAPKPRFSYALQVDDKKAGNGDGALQLNEKVELNIEVTNIGAGEAKEAVVTLKNLAGEAVFIERGREKLGALKPGASHSANLKFVLRDELPTPEVLLRVSVWDSTLGATLSEVLKIPVLPAQKMVSEVRTLKVPSKDEVPIYSGATPTAPIIAYARPGGTLKSDARIEDLWRRIEVQPGVLGFIREVDVKAQKGALKMTPKQAVRVLAAQAAPTVTLDAGGLVTSDDVLHLRGTISDERTLKDVFVFINEKKVFYRSLSALKGNENGLVLSPLDINLPLKKGSNAVTVVVRENDDVLTRRSFGLFRGQADAVAERREPQKEQTAQ